MDGLIATTQEGFGGDGLWLTHAQKYVVADTCSQFMSQCRIQGDRPPGRGAMLNRGRRVDRLPKRAQLPESSVHSEHVDAIDAGLRGRMGYGAAQDNDGDCRGEVISKGTRVRHVVGKFFADEARRDKGVIDACKPAEGDLAEAGPHGIADQKRPG